MRLWLGLLWFSTALWGQRGPSELAANFAYDRAAPLDVQILKTDSRDGVEVRDISYASPKGGRVPAYLVIPGAPGPHASILFGHWMKAGSPYKNRSEFLEEAVVLARAGAVSLLIDAPFVRPGFVEQVGMIPSAEQAARLAQQQVIDLRRGIDLLMAQPGIDPLRIAYVGHSFSAHVGAILLAVDKRIRSAVLMAGQYADEENTFSSNNAGVLAIRKEVGDEAIRAYFMEFWWDDPVHFTGSSGPAPVFLQFANGDLSEARAKQEFARFGGPREMELYEATHALNAAARVDRIGWLTKHLALNTVAEGDVRSIRPIE